MIHLHNMSKIGTFLLIKAIDMTYSKTSLDQTVREPVATKFHSAYYDILFLLKAVS